MRKFILLSAATLLSAVVSAQTVARMDDLKPEQKSMAVSLKLTGELSTTGNSDYRQLRDLCFQMRSVDLSEAQSTAIPNNAFHSRHQLEQITLPTAAKSIGSQAFFACDQAGQDNHSGWRRDYRRCRILGLYGTGGDNNKGHSADC